MVFIFYDWNIIPACIKNNIILNIGMSYKKKEKLLELYQILETSAGLGTILTQFHQYYTNTNFIG